MSKKYIVLLLLVVAVSCSKKHHAETANAETNKPAAKKKIVNPHATLPKTLTVDDRVASRAPDGRLYFDLQGHRYWKNYNDGKYYLYNQAMYNDPAFKPH